MTIGVDERREWVQTAATVVVLVAIAAAAVALRWPGFTQGGFASHDVAGILYNAMVLDSGGLPYVDTLELKAPGTFYLAKWLAGPHGRDIGRFQIWANAWGVASVLAVAGLAWRLWGRLGGIAAAGLYALHDAHLDSMDANYVTWANLPQILGFWLGVEAARARGRWRIGLWISAGAAAGLAALCKRPDGVVLPVLLAMAAAGPWLGGPADSPVGGSRARQSAGEAASVVGGFVLAHVPISIAYLSKGQFRALIDGYVLNRWGLNYLGAREASLLESAREGAFATAHFVGLPLCLAAFALSVTLVAWGRGRAGDERVAIAWTAAWALGCLVAASLGFRFYKGYFLAVAAPLCVLAAAPVGLLGSACRLHWAPRTLLLAASLVLVGRQLVSLEKVRLGRARPHDLGGQRIAAHIGPRLEPQDTIWVWGWHLWDVYPMTGHASGSRIYKSLGILTQPNDDSWRRPAAPLKFVESEYSRMLIADLERSRPKYIVLGSTVPRGEFEALQSFLRTHYRRDRAAPRIGRVQFWKRKRSGS